MELDRGHHPIAHRERRTLADGAAAMINCNVHGNEPSGREGCFMMIRRLAFSDEEFMTSEDTRGIRFQLEYLKVETRMREAGINSTIVLFGGARIPEPGKPAWAAKNETQRRNLEANSRYYTEARRFAQYASLTAKALDYKDYVIVTGGGPGVMEAGNRGAHEVGAPSVGMNIVLPHEQAPNPYVTPELAFNFHYFATRKIHLVLRARAVAIFLRHPAHLARQIVPSYRPQCRALMREHTFLARAAESPVALVPARHVELAGDVQHLVQFLRRRLVRQRRRRTDPDLRRLA